MSPGRGDHSSFVVSHKFPTLLAWFLVTLVGKYPHASGTLVLTLRHCSFAADGCQGREKCEQIVMGDEVTDLQQGFGVLLLKRISRFPVTK